MQQNQLCGRIWRNKRCSRPVELSATSSTRYIHHTNRLSYEEALAHPQIQNTTHEIAQHFNRPSQHQSNDSHSTPSIRRPNRNTPLSTENASKTTQPPRSIFTYTSPRKPQDPHQTPPPTPRPPRAGAVDLRTLAARPPRSAAIDDHARNLGARPPRTSAIDARNLGASPPASDRPFQRQPTNLASRSTRAGAGLATRPRTDTSRSAPTNAPLRRPRQQRTQVPAVGIEQDIAMPASIEEGGEGVVDYLAKKMAEVKIGGSVPYVPAEVSRETLSGMGLGLVLGGAGWGVQERVVDWVDGVGRRRGGAKGGEKEGKGAEGNGDEESGKVGEMLKKGFEEKLAERVFRGDYVFEGREEKGVLDTLRRQAVRNGSYFPKDGESLTEKVRSLLPVEKGEGGRGDVRA